MCNKLFYAFTVIIFCLTIANLCSQVTTSAATGIISIKHDGEPQFKYLDKLKSGGLAVSWIVYSDSQTTPGAKREQKYFWVGTLDAFTFTNIDITTSKDGKIIDINTLIWGRRNGTRWQSTSYEKGIVDVNSNPTAQTKNADNLMLYPLTDVLTMGFGLHWAINSMRLSSDGKVTGKAANFPDGLEGQITYFPNGQIQNFFYTAPKWNQSFLLEYSYQTNQIIQDQFPIAFILSIAGVFPTGKPFAAAPLEKYEILNISDITSDIAKSAGVPDPSLSKNALITNGVTKAHSYTSLTPEVVGAVGRSKSDAPMFSTEKLRTIIIRIIILAIFILPLLVVAFVAFKKRNSIE